MTADFYDFRYGLEPLAMIGKLRAYGDRILARAILWNEHYQGPIQLVDYGANEIKAFQIVSVGAGVKIWCETNGEESPKPGDFVDIRSVSGDRVNPQDGTSRYWLVKIADMTASADKVPWDYPGLKEACESYEKARLSQFQGVDTTQAEFNR